MRTTRPGTCEPEDGARSDVIGNETVHARLDGPWLGTDPGHEIPLASPSTDGEPFTGEHRLGKPA